MTHERYTEEAQITAAELGGDYELPGCHDHWIGHPDVYTPTCHGHPTTEGPIGNVVYCDGTCNPEEEDT